MLKLGEILTDKIRDLTADRFGREEERWDRGLCEELQRALPNVFPEAGDLLWNADVVGAVLDSNRRCAGCNPGRWLYSPKSAPEDPARRSCAVPLLPVVVRDPHLSIPAETTTRRLRLTWLSCQVYRDWVHQHANRQAEEDVPKARSRGRRPWGPRTYAEGPRA